MEVKVKLVPSGYDEDGNEQFLELDQAIVVALKPALRETVERHVNSIEKKTIKEIVAAKVGELTTEAFGRAYQKTDGWGNHSGDPISIPDIVIKETKAFLEQKVDANGRVSYSGEPRIKVMTLEAIRDVVKGELQERLKMLRAEFAEYLQKQLTTLRVS